MGEAEQPGVQAQAPDRVDLGAVQPVSYDCVTRLRKVSANLILATGFEFRS